MTVVYVCVSWSGGEFALHVLSVTRAAINSLCGWKIWGAGNQPCASDLPGFFLEKNKSVHQESQAENANMEPFGAKYILAVAL